MAEIILLKYSSRSRNEFFFRGLDSFINNLANKEDYWVLCTFDIDDTAMFNPETIQRLNTYKNLSYYFGTSTGKINAINRDLDKLPKFDILLNFSDDMIWTKFGFDDEIRKDINSLAGTDWFIHYPDDNVGERLSTLSILGYEYFKRNNFIYNPAFRSVYADNLAQDEAKYLGRYVYFNKHMFSHLHPAFGKAENDPQYLITEDKEGYQIDHQTYLRLKKELFV